MYWLNTESSLPEPGVVVETISPGGMEQDLIYQDGLWFFDDMSMYIYYTPMFWREKR